MDKRTEDSYSEALWSGPHVAHRSFDDQTCERARERGHQVSQSKGNGEGADR